MAGSFDNADNWQAFWQCRQIWLCTLFILSIPYKGAHWSKQPIVWKSSPNCVFKTKSFFYKRNFDWWRWLTFYFFSPCLWSSFILRLVHLINLQLLPLLLLLLPRTVPWMEKHVLVLKISKKSNQWMAPTTAVWSLFITFTIFMYLYILYNNVQLLNLAWELTQ